MQRRKAKPSQVQDSFGQPVAARPRLLAAPPGQLRDDLMC